MIDQVHKPLNPQKAQQLRKWLQAPECRIFMEFLAGQAAALTIDAGEKLVESQDKGDNENIEATQKAEEARRWANAYNIIDKAKGDNYTFETVELTTEKPPIES